MPTVAVTLALGDYDRGRPLHEGSIQPAGVALPCLRLPVEEVLFRMVRFGEFDAAELSLSGSVLV